MKIVEDILYRYEESGSKLTVLVTDEAGNDRSIADIDLSDGSAEIAKMTGEAKQEHLYGIAFKTAKDMGYILSGYAE